MAKPENVLPTSDHFVLERLADGLYAAVATPGGAAFSNAGIVDLGDRTLIFDTFETPVAAEAGRAAAEQLTGRSATYVINSHVHADHWCGNQVFAAETAIIATHTVRAEMPEAVEWLQELKEDPGELTRAIEEERADLEKESDSRRIASLEASISRMTGWLEGLPSLEFCLPTQTFEGRLAFHGSRRSAELVEVHPGHTSNDAYLVLSDDRIMFMGDLGFFQTQPFMVYCNPDAWMEQLEEMAHSEIETFVPGHGPVGTRDDITLQCRYIALVEELAARVAGQGGSPDDAIGQALPPPFDAWLHGGMARWEANIESAFRRLAGAAAV
ncbi:MBL fold metallo-hydrolase [Chloroflexota bacterium]